ncbi:Transcriptional regulator, GntR family domain / Aspartate aminotransferase [Labilithrix luteola]|uniref:Transcriptional regulator, GntR family domain / Aspartate aminotransferase n=1 Tax=Labilithrix luteola TaxID=1391654 RepID=A0A0K1QFT6_9BACT|nr:PLP-dependent aminotransferase family protein [Labilithrix luteola]AKV04280.1 Transcriptional regulator, GntR family domain / Aspartate aminotransferase [Labilithrix luteola]
MSQQTQLTRALIHEIQRGRLPPGSMLPGSRTLADQLGVNRKVVVAAVDELVAQGWLETRPASGTRVAALLPRSAIADVELPSPRKTSGSRREASLVSITDGLPDARLAPLAELSRAYARALRSLRRMAPGYSDVAGEPGLREVISGFVNQARGLSTTTDDIFLTRGAQGALGLYALSMLEPGDVVAAEVPGYAPAWRAFEFAGAKVVHIPVDGDGLRTDVLEKTARRLSGKLKAVYVTPHHQYPTSVAMTPERRMKLLQLAERFDFTVLEDDYDYEYHFDGEPLLPLHATGGSRLVVYIGSLSKLLAPSVRLGYLVASDSCIRRLKNTRELLERQGDIVLERAIAELFEDGTIQRHARRARREYEARRDHLIARLSVSPALETCFDYTVPAGGLALWLTLRQGTVESLVARAREERLLIAPGSTYLPKGRLDAIRFGFAAHDTKELSRICEKLARCVPS